MHQVASKFSEAASTRHSNTKMAPKQRPHSEEWKDPNEVFHPWVRWVKGLAQVPMSPCRVVASLCRLLVLLFLHGKIWNNDFGWGLLEVPEEKKLFRFSSRQSRMPDRPPNILFTSKQGTTKKKRKTKRKGSKEDKHEQTQRHHTHNKQGGGKRDQPEA